MIADNPNILLFSSTQLKEIIPLQPNATCTSLPEKLGFQPVPILEPEAFKPNSPPPLISIVVLGYDFEGQKANNFKKNQLSKIKQAWKQNAIAQSMDAS